MSRRLIAHLDMDAFYASVELLRYPELRGKPVVIGGRRRNAADDDRSTKLVLLRDYVGRGVATTATYEARALGVHSAMGLMKAASLAPEAILLPADFDEYRRLSRLFKQAVADEAPLIEDRGIDEIYIDLTDVPGAQDATPDDPLAGARRLARRLQQRVWEATSLSCSIGVTPNKLLSKLCSDLEKPRGVTVIDHADVPARIWPLPARRINGIGPKATAKLETLGITTIGELAAASPQWLIEHFGTSFGAWLHDASHGRDDKPVVTHRDPKSVSRETTFERDLHARHDRAALTAIFTGLCQKVASDLARKKLMGKTVGLKLRFDDFRTVTRDLTLPAHTDDAAAIRAAAGQCLKRIELSRRIRLLGVRVGSLLSADEAALTRATWQQKETPCVPRQLSFFDDAAL
nr:DNA polymerase IV [Pseudomonas sp.]